MSSQQTSSSVTDVVEVLQWEPLASKLNQVASGSPTVVGEPLAKKVRRLAFRSDCGAWLAFRSVTLRSDAGGFEVKDLDYITPPDASKGSAYYYWNSGPGGNPAHRSASPGGPKGGAAARSVSFAVPVSQEQRRRSHHRWRVPFVDIVSVERYVFTQPAELVFKSNGELSTSQTEAASQSTSRKANGVAADSSVSSANLSSYTPSSSSSSPSWPFRLWGPCGVIIHLAGDVDLFLVCGSETTATQLETRLLQSQKQPRSPQLSNPQRPRIASPGPPSPSSPPLLNRSPKSEPRVTSPLSTDGAPWSSQAERVYNPSFAAASSSGARRPEVSLYTPLVLPTRSGASPVGSPTVPPSGVEAERAQVSLRAGLSSSSTLSSPALAPLRSPVVQQQGSSAVTSLPSWQRRSSSYVDALVPQLQQQAPPPPPPPAQQQQPQQLVVAPLTSLSGTPPSKRTMHMRPIADHPTSFVKIHWVPGGDTKKPLFAQPFPPQLLYLSKHHTCFLHRVEHRLRRHRTPPCVAIDLLQTTVINHRRSELSFAVEYASLSLHPQDWSHIATIKEVPHPLAVPGQLRSAYVVVMEVLAPSLKVKNEWIEWMGKRGAFLDTRSDTLPVPQLMAPVGVGRGESLHEQTDSGPRNVVTEPAAVAKLALVQAATQKEKPQEVPQKAPNEKPVTSPGLVTKGDGTATVAAGSAPHGSPSSPVAQEETGCYDSSITPRHLSSSIETDPSVTGARRPTISPASPPSPPSVSQVPDIADARDKTDPVSTSQPTADQADALPRPKALTRVTPVWVSASYSPDGAKSAGAVTSSSFLHTPLSIKTSANATPYGYFNSSAIGGQERHETDAEKRGTASVSAKLSLLADTSASGTVDVDATGNTSADIASETARDGEKDDEDEPVYDAPNQSPNHSVTDAETTKQQETAEQDDAEEAKTFVVERPTHVDAVSTAARAPMQVLAASTSLRRHAPALPLQEAPATASGTPPAETTTAAQPVTQSAAPKQRAARVLPPPTPPTRNSDDGQDSDFDAVAYRLEQLRATSNANGGRPTSHPSSSSASPATPKQRKHEASRMDDAHSPIIYDSSVVLTSSGSPGTPPTRSRWITSAVTSPPDGGRTETTAVPDNSHGADHFDSPAPHSRATPRSVFTSPASSVKPPSCGSPLPAMRGQILFHNRDSATRDSSAARTFPSLSPPTSRNSTADVVTAGSTPLRSHLDEDDDVDDRDGAAGLDESTTGTGVVYCSPDVLQSGAATSNHHNLAAANGSDEQSPPLRPVRMAPLPTPTERVEPGNAETEPTTTAISVPLTMRRFFDDGYTAPVRPVGNANLGVTRDTRTANGHATAPPAGSISDDRTRMSSAERKEAFRKSLHALRAAHGGIENVSH